MPGLWIARSVFSGAAPPGAPEITLRSGQYLRTSGRVWYGEVSPDYLEGPPPASLVKEMNHHVHQKSHPLADGGPQILVRRGLKRPIDKHRPSDHIFPRNKAPVAAVVTYVPIVSHREVAVGRNHQVITLNILRQKLLPIREKAVVI